MWAGVVQNQWKHCKKVPVEENTFVVMAVLTVYFINLIIKKANWLQSL